ncbi:unnamed protein product [Rotaria sp. Silwood1]|nr:unnamed protein product [Rotaria sp. Silwood1]CAF3487397.1 unnamed protein product [Rotaria sp. Silwood1]CAF4601645.1 unnamed protein product [Rotaria sp. Silwood1]CAF4971101.1 unnamed protein product [Rotaria sp. Silwood1]
MIYFIKLFIYLIYLLNKSSGIKQDILLINDPSHNYQTTYTIISSNNRIKRDQLSLILPDITKNQILCEHDINIKLSNCLNLEECRTFSTCLDSIQCPVNIKNFGSLILNLLRLLGLNSCYTDDINQLCPHDKRVMIFQILSTQLSRNKDDDYCNNIFNFMNEIKNEVQNRCPLNVNQVEVFLENYTCSTFKNENIDVTSLPNRDELKNRLYLSNTENILATPSTKLSSQIAYIDEDNDLKFIKINTNPFNTSDQTVYVNDHQYYNVSYIIPKSEGIPINFVQDNNQFTHIHELSNRHRTAFGISLKFGFPFYGHTINKVLIATGGFIYTGDLLHAALVGSTQYIAPFMANFDASIGKNETEIKYYDNGTHFICTWQKIYLQDQQDAGSFTFQVILQNTGNIYFNYLQIPKIKISNTYHDHRIGLSDAYMSQHSTRQHIARIITLYNKISLDKEKITNGVSVVFDMDQICNTFSDCSSCLANRGKRHNCSWCDDIQKCSDGYDRSHQQWVQAQCHHLASTDTCPNSMEDIYDNSHFPSSSSLLPSIVHYEKRRQSSFSSSQQHSTLQTFRTILITLLLSVLILSLVALTITYIYAYRNPTSPAGMWLLEHRPSTYIARFKRSTGSI